MQLDFTKRQIEIIESAISIIGELGIHKLTIKNLAEKMAFTEPALYRHFKSKEEILASVLKYYKNDLKNYMLPIIEDDKLGLLKVEDLFKFQINHFKNNPAIVMVIFSETSFQGSQLLSNMVLEIMNEKRTILETIIKKGQLDKSIRNDIDKEQLATLIMGSMRLKILQWRLMDFKTNIDNVSLELWGTFKKILR